MAKDSKKKWILIFILAFALNFIWENLHSFLYADYQGGKITEFILARAALADAVIILGMIIFSRLIPFSKNRPWILILLGVIIAVLIEKWALLTGRWQYNDAMPIIPFLGIGLTPTIQLGFLGHVIHRIIFKQRYGNF